MSPPSTCVGHTAQSEHGEQMPQVQKHAKLGTGAPGPRLYEHLVCWLQDVCERCRHLRSVPQTDEINKRPQTHTQGPGPGLQDTDQLWAPCGATGGSCRHAEVTSACTERAPPRRGPPTSGSTDPRRRSLPVAEAS